VCVGRGGGSQEGEAQRRARLPFSSGCQPALPVRRVHAAHATCMNLAARPGSGAGGATRTTALLHHAWGRLRHAHRPRALDSSTYGASICAWLASSACGGACAGVAGGGQSASWVASWPMRLHEAPRGVCTRNLACLCTLACNGMQCTRFCSQEHGIRAVQAPAQFESGGFTAARPAAQLTQLAP
jgi:hypothetical protein